MKSDSTNLITAIIPTKNRPDELQKCVFSIISQNRRPNELVIVDQSNNEISRSAIEQLWNPAGSGSSLVYIHDPAISGLIEAKKRGVEESNGDIILFLEDDVVLSTDYFHMMEQGFNKIPEMYGCCGVVREVPGKGSFYRLIFKLFHRGIFTDARVGIHGKPSLFDGRLIPSIYLSGGISAYRKVVFEKVNFDTENGFFMLEDIDFSTRAARIFGANAFYINTGAMLDHALSPVNRALVGKKYENKFREYTLFYKKNSDHLMALPAFIWLIIGLTLEAGMAAIHNMNVIPLVSSWRGLIKGIRWRIKPIQE